MWYNIGHLAYTHLHLVRNLQVVHGRTVRSVSTHVVYCKECCITIIVQ